MTRKSSNSFKHDHMTPKDVLWGSSSLAHWLDFEIISIFSHKREKHLIVGEGVKKIKHRCVHTILLILIFISKASKVAQSCPTLCDPHGLWPTSLLCPWGFPGKNTGAGCHFLLQGIFPTQGSNPGLPHYRQTLYPLSHQWYMCKRMRKEWWGFCVFVFRVV